LFALSNHGLIPLFSSAVKAACTAAVLPLLFIFNEGSGVAPTHTVEGVSKALTAVANVGKDVSKKSHEGSAEDSEGSPEDAEGSPEDAERSPTR
jgi:hypothetical protein